MKNNIKDYIGRSAKVSFGGDIGIRQNMILCDDGTFIDPLVGYDIILQNGDPLIVLQKLPDYFGIYVIATPYGITWMSDRRFIYV